MILEPGQRLAQRYTLGERIAVGGMGEVWQGVDEVLGRPVAVKALRQDLSADRAFRARFREEARTAGGLSHGGIAAVYDYGEEGSLSYLVMELVEGEPLSALLARSGAVDVDTTLDLIAQTARALHAAHLRGVVHRDIKPANLLVTPEMRIKVTDFGIARPRDHEPLTATGQVMGTAHYLAPELARGEVASPLSDVYALGIVAYECLAGRRPFEGENQIAVATAQLMEEPPPLPIALPVPVRRVVESALAKRPTDRPAGAYALAVLLEDLHRARRVNAARAAGTSTSALTSPLGSPLGSPLLPRGELPDVAPAPAGVLGASRRAGSGRAGQGSASSSGRRAMGVPTSRASATHAGAGAGGSTGYGGAGPGGRDPMGPPTPVLPVIGGRSRRAERDGRDGRAASGRKPSLTLLTLSGLAVVALLGAALSRGDDPVDSTRTPGVSISPTTPRPTGARTPGAAPSTAAAPSSSTAGPGSSGTTSSGTRPGRVTIRPSDYVGTDLAAARKSLAALGMKVRVRRVIRPKIPKGRVVGIEPSGSIVQGSTVTLVVADGRGP